MNLVIDIGNTAIKLAVFDKGKLQWVWNAGDALDLKKFKNKDYKFQYSIVSSVISDDKKLVELLSMRTKLIRFSHKTPLPFKNRYKTPATLGLDRLASVAGAWKKFPKKNVLVIDAGTCIKYDFINSKGEYLGGSISPGLQMRFNALHNFTDRLPLIKPEPVKALTGDSTKNSILTGVITGMTIEIKGFIEEYKSRSRKNRDKLKVILTGGDSAFLKRQLKSSIFVAPNLTLEGLHEILRHNVD